LQGVMHRLNAAVATQRRSSIDGGAKKSLIYCVVAHFRSVGIRMYGLAHEKTLLPESRRLAYLVYQIFCLAIPWFFDYNISEKPVEINADRLFFEQVEVLLCIHLVKAGR